MIAQGVLMLLNILISECGFIELRIDIIPMIEEGISTNTPQFHRVQEKLGLLAQSKMQNLSEQSLKQVQGRLQSLEKSLMDQITRHDTSFRNYRLQLRSAQEQGWDIQHRCKENNRERSAQIALLQQQISTFMKEQSEQSSQKGLWGITNSQEKIEKTEKQVRRVKPERKEDFQSLNQSITRQVACHEAQTKSRAQVLDNLLSSKSSSISLNCSSFRDEADRGGEQAVRKQQEVMNFLRGAVSEIKGMINSQQEERKANRDRLRAMLQQATVQL